MLDGRFVVFFFSSLISDPLLNVNDSGCNRDEIDENVEIV